MKHLCVNCGYIYDEINGELEDGIAQGTKLDNIRENFICPNCFESSDNFQEIKPYIHNLNDSKNLLGIELEHMPKFEFLEDGYIKIWLDHPTEKEHFIGNISIIDEYGDLVYEEFFKPGELAYLEYDISNLDDFEIRIECSLHGVFAKKIKREN